MRDWTRYEEAKRLRDSGRTMREIGQALGVSPGRASQMLEDLRRHQEQLALEVKNQATPAWGEDLNPSTRSRLEAAALELVGHGWSVKPPGAWSSGEAAVTKDGATGSTQPDRPDQPWWDLSVRASNVLLFLLQCVGHDGITPEAVQKAIDSGASLQDLPNCGPLTQREIGNWLAKYAPAGPER